MTAQLSADMSLLNVKETAEILRKSESQLKWMIHSGTAPRSALIARRRMFRMSDIEKYIEDAFDDQ